MLYNKKVIKKEKKPKKFIQSVFEVWKYAYTLMRLDTTNKLYPDEKEYFVRDRMYNSFLRYDKFCEVNLVDKFSYLRYLIYNKVKYKNWINDNFYKEYLKNKILLESKEKALKRSENFIKTNKIDMNNISINRLKLYINTGNISPWILFKKYPDILKKFDKYDIDECQPLLDLKVWQLKLENDKCTSQI